MEEQKTSITQSPSQAENATTPKSPTSVAATPTASATSTASAMSTAGDSVAQAGGNTAGVQDSVVDSSTALGEQDEVLISVEDVFMTFRSYSHRYDTLKELFVGRLHGRIKRKDIECLKGVSFQIKRGEKVAIFGRNGAGKSTLLKIVSGILTPTSGQVKINGRITPLLRLGAGFDANDSGINNIYLNGAIMGYTKKEIKEKEQEIIEFSELGDFIYEPVKNYSSGMTARLGFSIAMCMNPDIVLIDEILAVGDGAFRKKCAAKFDELKQRGATMVIVTHSTNISATCERAIWIKDGKVAMDGNIKEVAKEYNAYLNGI